MDRRSTYEQLSGLEEELETCRPMADPPAVYAIHGLRREDGSCEVRAMGDSDGPEWSTVCKDTTCFCVRDDEPLCSCETEVPWCDVPTPSCCPMPFP